MTDPFYVNCPKCNHRFQTQSEDAVLSVIRERGEMSLAELKPELKWSKTAIHHHLQNLVQKKKLERTNFHGVIIYRLPGDAKK